MSIIFTATASTWAWFKNNYITSKGNEQRKVLQQSNLTR
ncbi:phage holin [Virgibacillus salarius]